MRPLKWITAVIRLPLVIFMFLYDTFFLLRLHLTVLDDCNTFALLSTTHNTGYLGAADSALRFSRWLCILSFACLSFGLGCESYFALPVLARVVPWFAVAIGCDGLSVSMTFELIVSPARHRFACVGSSYSQRKATRTRIARLLALPRASIFWCFIGILLCSALVIATFGQFMPMPVMQILSMKRSPGHHSHEHTPNSPPPDPPAPSSTASFQVTIPAVISIVMLAIARMSCTNLTVRSLQKLTLRPDATEQCRTSLELVTVVGDSESICMTPLDTATSIAGIETSTIIGVDQAGPYPASVPTSTPS